MKKVFLIFAALILTITSYAQSFLGKTKEEIQQMVKSTYEEVELVSESEGSFKLLCDDEINEFFLVDSKCSRFNSIKSYKCDCLVNDIKAYNQNLEAVGNMKWLSKDGLRIYEIILDKEQYVVSIAENDKNMMGFNSRN